MPVDKIDVNDSRILKLSANLNGRTYGYLLGQPKDYRGTIFLIHGFPDISMGWRYQIPMLMNLGLRVVAPDSMGYGRTDAPPYKLSDYSYKRAANDMKELANQLGATKIILGGHDWGGAIVYRIALWYPDLVTHVFSVCTPFWAPSNRYETLDQMVKKRYSAFKYQQHFESGEIEEAIQSRNEIRQFLTGMYGGRGPNREIGMRTDDRVYLEHLHKLAPSILLTKKEMDYYVDEYSRHGIHGPLNWYRTREINFDDELELRKKTIDIPVLFILASRDTALRPEMAVRMNNFIPQLTRRELNASHWALWEKPEEVNNHIKQWIGDVVFGSKSKL